MIKAFFYYVSIFFFKYPWNIDGYLGSGKDSLLMLWRGKLGELLSEKRATFALLVLKTKRCINCR